MAIRKSASQWARVVKKWKRSGETATEFGARVGVKPAALHSWRWRLRKAGLLKDDEVQSAVPEFLPVHIVSDDREFEPARVHDQHVDIVVDEHNTVRVLPGFDDMTLRRVLNVLREKGAR
jgi:hypothetical protein